MRWTFFSGALRLTARAMRAAPVLSGASCESRWLSPSGKMPTARPSSRTWCSAAKASSFDDVSWPG